MVVKALGVLVARLGRRLLVAAAWAAEDFYIYFIRIWFSKKDGCVCHVITGVASEKGL